MPEQKYLAKTRLTKWRVSIGITGGFGLEHVAVFNQNEWRISAGIRTNNTQGALFFVPAWFEPGLFIKAYDDDATGGEAGSVGCAVRTMEQRSVHTAHPTSHESQGALFFVPAWFEPGLFIRHTMMMQPGARRVQ
ncbi:MAG: hypothetical protein Q8N48_08645 [Thiobacillus sp.]|nr:hypothetical protein [Thiobacillus sp.]MDP2978879.1 hypothetical protein [Thiobacillus sp.]